MRFRDMKVLYISIIKDDTKGDRGPETPASAVETFTIRSQREKSLKQIWNMSTLFYLGIGPPIQYISTASSLLPMHELLKLKEKILLKSQCHQIILCIAVRMSETARYNVSCGKNAIHFLNTESLF
jgi:hypothetical protein